MIEETSVSPSNNFASVARWKIGHLAASHPRTMRRASSQLEAQGMLVLFDGNSPSSVLEITSTLNMLLRCGAAAASSSRDM
jgi:hypothetical protein